jgi:hypothetical protein
MVTSEGFGGHSISTDHQSGKQQKMLFLFDMGISRCAAEQVGVATARCGAKRSRATF